MTESVKKKQEKKGLEDIKAKAKAYYFDAEKEELKSLKQIFDRTTQVKEIFVEHLGCKVKFGHISMADMADLMKIEDKNIMGLEMLFRIMRNADPDVKKEWVYGLPIDVATAMIIKIQAEGLGFLKDTQPPKTKRDT